MSFAARLAEDQVAVDPGSTVVLSVEVANRGDATEQFELSVEGLDPEWTAIPIPTFPVEVGEIHVEKALLKPPRASESVAGNYPFVVRVRSLATGESRAVQGMLTVKPFHSLSLEIGPKKGYVSAVRKQNAYEVTLLNLGNQEHTVALHANDPEDGCAYVFEEERVTVGPGQQKTVVMTAEPVRKRFFAGSRLYGINVGGRSVEVPSVAASAQAQLEQRPVVSIASLVFFLLAAALIGGWIALIPKPPIFALDVDRLEVTAGEPIEIRWQSQHATQINLQYGGQTVSRETTLSGSLKYVPTVPGELSISGYASRDGRRSDVDTVLVKVNPPVKVPDPVIERFTVSPQRVAVGEKVTVTFRFNSAVTEAYLEPSGEQMILDLRQQEVALAQPGTFRFALVAKNAAGRSVRSREVTVTAVEESQAAIVRFDAAPTRVRAADEVVSLRWQVTNSALVQIQANGQVFDVEAEGERTFTIERTTTFKLVAKDAKGIATSREVRVEFEPPAEPPAQDDGTTAGQNQGLPPPPTTAGGDGGTGGGR